MGTQSCLDGFKSARQSGQLGLLCPQVRYLLAQLPEVYARDALLLHQAQCCFTDQEA